MKQLLITLCLTLSLHGWSSANTIDNPEMSYSENLQGISSLVALTAWGTALWSSSHTKNGHLRFPELVAGGSLLGAVATSISMGTGIGRLFESDESLPPESSNWRFFSQNSGWLDAYGILGIVGSSLASKQTRHQKNTLRTQSENLVFLSALGALGFKRIFDTALLLF